MDVQADLGLCCPHMPKDTFSHNLEHFLNTFLPFFFHKILGEMANIVDADQNASLILV